MSHPNDPTESLPTPRVPADGATMRLDPHRPAPPPDEPTVHLAAGEPTTQFAVDGAAVHPVPEATATHPGRTIGVATALPGRTGAGEVGSAGGEVRFGPGVPATPPPAPAWPAPALRPRRRSVWRRLTSLLSGLLTVALVVVVGLYLWQRLRPLEVAGVTVATPAPAGCDATVDVVATITTNRRAGEVRYQWLRSGSAPGTVLTERVGRGQRTVTVTLRWSFNGVGATVNIVAPSAYQAQTAVSYDCRR